MLRVQLLVGDGSDRVYGVNVSMNIVYSIHITEVKSLRMRSATGCIVVITLDEREITRQWVIRKIQLDFLLRSRKNQMAKTSLLFFLSFLFCKESSFFSAVFLF